MLVRIAVSFSKTPRQLATEIGFDEFVELWAFYNLEPWGFEADRYNTGLVASAVVNWAGRQHKRGDKKPSDFMPKRGKPRRRMTTEQMRARVKADIEKAKRNG